MLIKGDGSYENKTIAISLKGCYHNQDNRAITCCFFLNRLTAEETGDQAIFYCRWMGVRMAKGESVSFAREKANKSHTATTFL
jgi:hypothetical protein